MDKKITIYHGSKQIVEVPVFGEGKKNNDFGLGFYCTESNDLAKEWAVSSLRDGFSNRYTLDTEYLNVLNLNSPDYTILNWIAVLLKYRLFTIKTPVARRAKRYVIDNFGVNVNAYDLIVGYRADDSYFDYAEAFINNTITVEQLARAMRLGKLGELGAEWVQFDEPSLVKDMTDEDVKLFAELYEKILSHKSGVKVLIQTYFGDVRDCYTELCGLDADGIGLDFTEGKKSLELLKKNGFPAEKLLFAGVVNGKNIWRNNYASTLSTLSELAKHTSNIVISTSCSLLHVPCTLANETKLDNKYKKHFAYAEEKLTELAELKKITSAENYAETEEYCRNAELHSEPRTTGNETVRKKVASLTEKDLVRLPEFAERERIQKERFKLPLLPTTTIGSFPQTAEIKSARNAHRKGELSDSDYEFFIEKKTAECIALQEEIGLDVLVHGEFERNDMVEYFGECLDGYLFTEKAWVQSYGTRCVKPPVVWGDISRAKPMTVRWSVYAQSLTDKPMKGMLTGPVTILNWSFPREDISLRESALQIALAIREEVLDLEANGISIIQVDEAALREKLPLRRADWREDYLDWAIPAFRYVHSGVKPETQIHTHMCYSEFADIIKDIDDMDADVITFEASRSDLTILDVLKENNFRTEVGPGVYDIHSPRVPSKEEIKAAIGKMLERIPVEKLWVNPDCGLKTRGNEETVPSLKNLVNAAREVRDENC